MRIRVNLSQPMRTNNRPPDTPNAQSTVDAARRRTPTTLLGIVLTAAMYQKKEQE